MAGLTLSVGYSYGYNANDALTSMSAATGAKYELGYTDAAHPDLPTTLTDPQGNVLAVAYDAPGNVRSLTNQLPTQNRVDLTYNGKGLTASSKDPNGNQTGYTYDAKGNLTAVVPPAPLGDVRISYDNLSRATAITDGKDQTTGYTYDALDRLTKTTNPDGTTVTYAYDGDGNLTQMTDLVGTTTMVYDGMGRLTSRTTPDGKQALYTYDIVGNMLHLELGEYAVDYSYNEVNLVKAITPTLSGPSVPVLGTITATYDANYNRTSLVYPEGPTVTTTYDTSNRMSGSAAIEESGTLYSVTYGYEDASDKDTALRQRANEFDHRVDRGSASVSYQTQTTYVYDKLNRLTQANVVEDRIDQPPCPVCTRTTREEHAYTYTYDGSGNRLTATVEHTTDELPLPTETKASTSRFNAANQIADTDGVPYAHDANGNMAAGPRGTHAYSTSDQTLSTTTAEGSAAFTYRGEGQAERTTAGPLSFSYSSLGLTSQTQGGTPIFFVRDPRGGLLSWMFQGGVFHYLLDGQGSVMGLTDGAGRLMARYSYDPFGQTRAVWTPSSRFVGDPFVPTGSIVSGPLQPTADVIARANPFRFASSYLDPTGLYHMGERYYDPALGRFTQQDPIHNPLDPKSWNRYVYVGNDPVNFIDPTGLTAWSKFKCIMGEFNPVYPSLASAGLELAGLASLIRQQGMTAGGVAVFGTIAPMATAVVVGAGGLVVLGIAVHKAWKEC